MVPPGYAPVWEDTLTANMLEKWTQAQFHREKDHWFFQHAGKTTNWGCNKHVSTIKWVSQVSKMTTNCNSVCHISPFSFPTIL